jgi:hypothetical protein
VSSVSNGFHPVIVLIGTRGNARHYERLCQPRERIAGHGSTTTDEQLPEGVFKRDEIALSHRLPTQSAVVEKASPVARPEPITPAVHQYTVTSQECW